ncbi:MAG: hypothetical protein ABR578_01175 [Chromatocurvus sp.]
MNLAEVVSPEALERYRQLTAQQIGVLYPREYLAAGKVFVCLNDDGEIVGGYAVILDPPFRAIESIPKAERWRVLDALWDVRFPICELTGLWLAPGYRGSRQTLALWRHISLVPRRYRRQTVVYAYSADKPDLGRLYGSLDSRVLYRGMTVQLEGMAAPGFESVEMAFSARTADHLAHRHRRIFTPSEPVAARALVAG